MTVGRKILSAALAAVVGAGALTAQVDPDAARRLIREFEEKNRLEKEAGPAATLSDSPTKSGGLDELKQELADARLAYLSNPSKEIRVRVAQATINYIDPLVRLQRLDEAVSALGLSIGAIGGDEILSAKLIELRNDLSDIALSGGDRRAALAQLESAYSEARAAKVSELITATRTRAFEFTLGWAEDLFYEGDYSAASKKAHEALSWRIDSRPVYALLGRIDYQRDRFDSALENFEKALRTGADRFPRAAFVRELVRREDSLRLPERRFERKERNGLILASAPNFSVDVVSLAAAFATAREEAEAMFGLSTKRPVRLSLYQRSDYFHLSEAPVWSAVHSAEGKLRLRSDALLNRDPDLRIAARYAYGIWAIAVLSDGTAPAWFVEGVAHHLAFPTGPPNGSIFEIRKRMERKEGYTFEELEPPFPRFLEFGDAATAMAQSHWTIRVLIEKSGLEAVPRLARAFRFSETPESALIEVVGFGYDRLTSDLQETLNEAFVTNPSPDISVLRSLGRVSPVGTYWER